MAADLTIRERPVEILEDHPLLSDVQAILAQILESQPFRTSKQCKDLLRYVVEHSLIGDDTSLKERIIGTKVFGRDPTYDTNDDPVVRMRAADVRKRLAQFYQSLDPGTPVLHIELQPGSYRVHFRYDPRLASPAAFIPTTIAPAPPPQNPEPLLSPTVLKRGRLALRGVHLGIAAVFLALLSGAALWIHLSWSTPQERFWAPLISSRQPVLIYLGSNVAYVFSSDFLARYRATHGIANTGPEFLVDLPPGSSISAGDIVPVKDTFVTNADTSAIVELTTQLRDWKRPFVLRSGSDLSIGDLRNQPSVMVGAFNNPWTLELTRDLPFSFREGVRIQSRDHPDQSWSVPSDTRSSTTDDYALITRVLSSRTGGPSITVAGIGEYGTQAAAEFLTSPEKMRDLLKSAPRGWEAKSMQAVLHVKVMGYQPVSVEVVATSYW